GAADAAGAGYVRVRPRDFALVIGAVLAFALPALLAMQRLTMVDGQMILLGYKIFSIFLGLALIITTWTINHKRAERARLEKVDLLILMLIAIPGGALTALFSVGVGELVALYLFIRHYPVLLCTGTACVISSISVLVGIVWHIEMDTVAWEIVLLAGPGAVLGAFLARPIALWLGAKRLKTLDGTWIVLSAVYLIVLNWVFERDGGALNIRSCPGNRISRSAFFAHDPRFLSAHPQPRLQQRRGAGHIAGAAGAGVSISVARQEPSEMPHRTGADQEAGHSAGL
ncbi:hypothetical protein C8024_05110, partial [Sphingopyxis sp. BSNA05]|uniref:sulfite exporter TauE/SafE family protein n=1 Tax=Sphingopyxis sp. BSNA05 TaxID=1236614 RepID=UPI00156755FD